MELFIPGRLCLFGEHSDWNAGNVGFGEALVVSTATGVFARANLVSSPSQPAQFTFIAPDGNAVTAGLSERDLCSALAQSPYFCYVLGAAAVFVAKYPGLPEDGASSVQIDNYRTTIPLKKGLSSSAAVCVLVVRALSMLLLGRRLSVLEETELAYQGERLTPSQCGRLDQISVSSLSDFPGQVGMIRFGSADNDITCQLVELQQPVYLLIATCTGVKDTIAILESLQTAARETTVIETSSVRELFGTRNRQVVTMAAELLQSGNAAELGKLATKAQSMFDQVCIPLCPSQLTAPGLHALLRDGKVCELACGGKGVGAGGDGTCFFVLDCKRKQTELLDYLQHTLQVDAYAMDLK
ncbi:hypothetical protein BASA81_003398 [Batrachochytrium salamandrivorans]|nr:hypothetical protein BASA81_003398 [Batrachochytrium salamandrivorans]